MKLPELVDSQKFPTDNTLQYVLSRLKAINYYQPEEIENIRKLFLPRQQQIDLITSCCSELKHRQVTDSQTKSEINIRQWQRCLEFAKLVKPITGYTPFWLFVAGSTVYDDPKKGDIDIVVATDSVNDTLESDVYESWQDMYEATWGRNAPTLDISYVNLERLRKFNSVLTVGTQDHVRAIAGPIDITTWFTAYILNGVPLIQNGDLQNFRTQTLDVLTLNPLFGALAINTVNITLNTRMTRSTHFK